MSKYIFRNELGGYESAYDKNSLMRLCYEEISNLEAKLAESEEEKETLRISQSSTHKTLMQLNDELLKTQKQLAEKDKEIQSLTNKNSRLIQGIFWGNGLQFSHEHKKDKIEFAIAELQRVETYFEKHGSINYYIYHRINELKEKE